ncbi:MAG: hypothetical protein RLZZ466_1345 [Bacteroidota bacterium]|jgi:hypothetical protein
MNGVASSLMLVRVTWSNKLAFVVNIFNQVILIIVLNHQHTMGCQNVTYSIIDELLIISLTRLKFLFGLYVVIF